MENNSQKDYEKILYESLSNVLLDTNDGEIKLSPVGGLVVLISAFVVFECLTILFKKGEKNNEN